MRVRSTEALSLRHCAPGSPLPSSSTSMFTVDRVLLLASVALAMHVALVTGDKCSSDTKGDTYGRFVALTDVILTPPTHYWNIQIPNNVPNCEKVGVELMCCDSESTPIVTMVTMDLATVQRTGPALLNATVKTKVYCRETQQPLNIPQEQGWISV